MTIAVGQCFTKTGSAFPDIWQVVGISEQADGVPHARLARIDFPQDTKTISVETLTNPRMYRAYDGGQVLRRRLGRLR